MPYIKSEDRRKFDALVSELGEIVRREGEATPAGTAGNLNYIISTLLAAVYGPSPRYHQHNEIIGLLECTKEEWYRRKTAPYEDEKILENGDVYGAGPKHK